MKSDELRVLQVKLINGAVGGVVGVASTFPLDLVKTQLQNQQANVGRRLYTGISDAFIKIYRTSALRGFYSGIGPNLLLISPEKAIKLSVNDILRRSLKGTRKEALPLHLECVAGAGAGFAQSVVTTPMELLKIRLQLMSNLTNRPSGLSIASEMFKSHGFFGLYRGLGATLTRDVSFSVVYFPLFARLNTLGLNQDGTSNPFYSLFAGIFAGGFSAWIFTPLDVVKTRIQANRSDGISLGISQCIRTIWQSEGIRAFFAGATARTMVIAPLFGIAQAVYYIGVGERILGMSWDKPTV